MAITSGTKLNPEVLKLKEALIIKGFFHSCKIDYNSMPIFKFTFPTGAGTGMFFDLDDGSFKTVTFTDYSGTISSSSDIPYDGMIVYSEYDQAYFRFDMKFPYSFNKIYDYIDPSEVTQTMSALGSFIPISKAGIVRTQYVTDSDYQVYLPLADSSHTITSDDISGIPGDITIWSCEDMYDPGVAAFGNINTTHTINIINIDSYGNDLTFGISSQIYPSGIEINNDYYYGGMYIDPDSGIGDAITISTSQMYVLTISIDRRYISDSQYSTGAFVNEISVFGKIIGQ